MYLKKISIETLSNRITATHKKVWALQDTHLIKALKNRRMWKDLKRYEQHTKELWNDLRGKLSI